MNVLVPAIVLSEVACLGVVFLFAVTLVWLGARRQERQAFYLCEMVKKIAASSGDSAAALLREHERAKNRRRLEAMTVGGFMGSLAAVGLMIFLYGLVPVPLYRVGLIPLLPSLGLLLYARFLAPRE
jgi:hypothetical protein